GLERVDYVEVMRPALGEVLPGVSARVAADEGFAPVRARAVFVMPLERGGIILALGAERLAEAIDAAAVASEHLPVVIAHLGAKRAEDGAVGLAELAAQALALGVVGLAQADRDDAAGVSGRDLGRAGVIRLGKKVEGEPVLGRLVAGSERQTEAQ